MNTLPILLAVTKKKLLTEMGGRSESFCTPSTETEEKLQNNFIFNNKFPFLSTLGKERK